MGGSVSGWLGEGVGVLADTLAREEEEVEEEEVEVPMEASVFGESGLRGRGERRCIPP